MKTLYKRTSTGATQEWTVEVAALPDGTAEIVTTYGQVGGQLLQSRVPVRTGKNLGRSNETTPLQQAEAEALAKWYKRKDKGYCETAEADTLSAAVERRPMLAHDYAKHAGKVEYPCFVQPKLDGMRCLAHKRDGIVTLVSRGNKPIETVPHIVADLGRVMRDGETWDGELYAHGETFQDLVSWVKRRQADSARVQYHVYDAITPEPFEERFWSVRDTIEDLQQASVFAVPTYPAGDAAEVKVRHDAFVADGYEGLMVRHSGCPYKEGGRSDRLLKLKAFLDQEMEVVGVGQGRGKFEGLAVFTLRTADGTEFEATPRGTEAQRRAYYEDRESLVGQMATVRFFEWTTSEKPVPRFPVVTAIRTYE